MKSRACSIEGCNTKHLARGWCSKHYQRWRVHKVICGQAGSHVRPQARDKRWLHLLWVPLPALQGCPLGGEQTLQPQRGLFRPLMDAAPVRAWMGCLLLFRCRPPRARSRPPWARRTWAARACANRRFGKRPTMPSTGCTGVCGVLYRRWPLPATLRLRGA